MKIGDRRLARPSPISRLSPPKINPRAKKCRRRRPEGAAAGHFSAGRLRHLGQITSPVLDAPATLNRFSDAVWPADLARAQAPGRRIWSWPGVGPKKMAPLDQPCFATVAGPLGAGHLATGIGETEPGSLCFALLAWWASAGTPKNPAFRDLSGAGSSSSGSALTRTAQRLWGGTAHTFRQTAQSSRPV